MLFNTIKFTFNRIKKITISCKKRKHSFNDINGTFAKVRSIKAKKNKMKCVIKYE